MSKLGNLCGRFIEAGWLVAVALVPLYINFFGGRGWSVEKAYFLRVVVLLMAGAWLVKLWEGGADRGLHQALAPLWKNPLALPVVVYLLVVLVSTAASVSPSLSFAGSFHHLQGAFSLLTYICMFCLLVLNLRTREQFDRIISVLLLAGIPIALYAVVQELALDPLPLAGEYATIGWPVRSTLGNHIFLGGYLVMVMPWTMARLTEAIERWRQGISNDASRVSTALLGAAGILVQNLILAFFLVYNSKGQLGWMTLPVLAGYLFLVVRTVRLEAKLSPLAMAVAYSVLLALQTISLVFTQARGPWVAAMGGAALFGLLISLRWRMWRFLVGMFVFAGLVGLFVGLLNLPQSPLQPLMRYASFKRLGSLSLSASEWENPSAGSILYRLLLWQSVGRLVSTWPNIGLSQDPLGRVRPLIGYGPETLGLTIEKVLAPGLGAGETWRYIQDRAHNDSLDQLADSGLLGFASFLFLIVTFYRMILKAIWQSQDRSHQLLLIALLTAVTTHLLEIQVGFGITVTRMLFWTFLALGIFLSRPLETTTSELRRESNKTRRSWMIPYVLTTLFLVLAQVTSLRIQKLHIGLFVGFAWLLVAMFLLALDFGLPSSEQTARWRNWWVYTIIVGVTGLLIYQGSFQPKLASAFFALSRSADQRRALLGYQESATIDPQQDVYYAQLGVYLTRLGLAVWVEKPDLKPPKRFQPSAALARALDFQNILGLGGEGILALAEASFQEARRLQPLDARRVFDLAQLNHLWGLHGRQERLEMALRYFAETAELSPNRLAVQVNWAMVYLDKNQPQVALERIQSAQSIGHESWFIHYALALIHNKLGNREVALKEAETAVRIRNLWDRIPKEFIPKLEEELKLPPGSLSKGI